MVRNPNPPSPTPYGALSKEEFVRLFPVTSNPDLAAITGLPRGTVSYRAHQLGLRKAHASPASKPGPKVTAEASAARFWAKVDKSGACWLWTGARQPSGYGKWHLRPKFVAAHRASWMLTYGPIPEGLCVLHRCDTPACVRPDHLFLGSFADNTADARRKNRLASGERHYLRRDPTRIPRGEALPWATLTEETVRAIKARLLAGERPDAVARSLGVGTSAVRHIANAETWTHVR